MPLVGLTTYHRDGVELPRFALPAAYVDAVRLAGGQAVLLPPGDEQPAQLLERLDALVLCGGGDLDPSLWGGPKVYPAQYATSPERDRFELELTRAALARHLPLLAICRGLQVLNVALGGDLVAHLPDEVGEAVAHRRSQHRHTYHPVEVAPDSHLARVLGSGSLVVASWHHQGVARPGRGLLPVARAPDGVVEALELEGHPEVLAVQWHPELQQEPGSVHRALFEELVRLGG